MKKMLSLIVPLSVSCGDFKAGLEAPDRVRYISPPSAPCVVKSMPSLPPNSDISMITHEFYADAQALGVKVDRRLDSISFIKSYGPKSDVVGLCEVFGYSNNDITHKVITIKESAWAAASNHTKRNLLYHELGHCALNLNHLEANAVAIMNPKLLSDELSAPSWFNLVRNMFNSASQNNASVASDTGNCKP